MRDSRELIGEARIKILSLEDRAKVHGFLNDLEQVEIYVGRAPQDAGALRTCAAEIHNALLGLREVLK